MMATVSSQDNFNEVSCNTLFDEGEWSALNSSHLCHVLPCEIHLRPRKAAESGGTQSIVLQYLLWPVFKFIT
jgi:hypothetical protein